MSRYYIRIATAILSFVIGLCSVWISANWKSFEDFVVDRFSSQETSIFDSSPDYVESVPIAYDDEEQAVYKATFKELFGSYGLETLFVSETTYCSDCNEESTTKDSIFGLPTKESLKAVESETYNDFLSKNKTRYKIVRLPDTPFRSYIHRVEPVLFSLSVEDTLSHIKEQNKFRTRHPKSRFVSVSRVGFNQMHTQAVIYVNDSGATWVDTRYILLKKVGGKWIFERIIGGISICPG